MKMSIEFNNLGEPPIVHIDDKIVRNVTKINVDWITDSEQMNIHEWSVSNIDEDGIEVTRKETNKKQFPNN